MEHTYSNNGKNSLLTVFPDFRIRFGSLGTSHPHRLFHLVTEIIHLDGSASSQPRSLERRAKSSFLGRLGRDSVRGSRPQRRRRIVAGLRAQRQGGSNGDGTDTSLLSKVGGCRLGRRQMTVRLAFPSSFTADDSWSTCQRSRVQGELPTSRDDPRRCGDGSFDTGRSRRRERDLDGRRTSLSTGRLGRHGGCSCSSCDVKGTILALRRWTTRI